VLGNIVNILGSENFTTRRIIKLAFVFSLKIH